MAPNKDDQFDDGLDQFDDGLPADDFADDALDSGEGEEAFSESEEEWDSYDESAEGDTAQPAAKKKSNTFNIILIAVAVLGGVGFMAMKMGGGQAPATAPAVVAQNTNNGTAVPPSIPTPAAIPPASPPPAPTGGFLTNPDNMRALEQDIAKTYGETELVGGDNAAPQEVDQAAPPMPTAVEQATVAPVLPTADLATENAAPIRMPNAAEAMLKSAIQEKNQAQENAAPTQPNVQTEAAPAVTAVLAQDAEQNAALVAKLDQVLSRLDQLEGDMRNLKTAQPAGDVAALADSVAALEKKLSEQVAQTAKVSAKVSEQAVAPKPAPRHEVTEAPAPKPQVLGSSAGNATPPLAPQASTAVPKWVLKGAQPGQAMVSKPGDSEMRSVVVGDSLPGIGTIRSIGYENGRWSVVGTQGRITQ
jgi:intracellular multiplication protein IcmG